MKIVAYKHFYKTYFVMHYLTIFFSFHMINDYALFCHTLISFFFRFLYIIGRVKSIENA